MKHTSKPSYKPSTVRATNIRRIAGNAFSILSSNVANRLATFIIYALVARYLGAFNFGQMALGFTFFQTFQLLAIAGLQTLITREVAKDKHKTNKYFVNGSLVVTLFSLLSILLLVLVTQVLGYATDTTFIILLLSLGLLPYALTVICDALFQAWERMHYITFVNVLVNTLKIGLTFLILFQGYGLGHIVVLILFSHLVNLIIKWWLILQHIIKPRLKFDLHFSIEMMKATSTFLGIRGAQAIFGSINIILLSKLATEVEVGLFSAVLQVLVPIGLIIQSVAIGIFPVMSRNFESGFQKLQKISEHLFEILLVLVLPMIVGLFMLSDSVLLLLYDNPDFAKASIALQIIVWTLVLRVFTQVYGRVLLASLQEKITLRILIIDTVAAIIIGPILISQFGLVGAAATALTVRTLDFIQHYIPISRMFRVDVISLASKPVMASMGIAVYLVMVRDHNLFLTISSAAVLYAAMLSTLMVWSVGGLKQFRLRYSYLWLR